MLSGMIGRKVGMTQIFDEDGRAVVVTVLHVGPCRVTQLKTPEKDGYLAAQLGFEEITKETRTNRPKRGHCEKAGWKGARVLKEFAIEKAEDVEVGKDITVKLFEGVKLVKITGTSKGKGFQGIMKLHNARGGPETHGSMFHREPGSIGSSAYPSRVFKNQSLPGHMGVDTTSVKNLEIKMINEEQNLLVVKGAVPGPKGGYVYILRG